MELFGYTGDNECVYEHILENKNGMRIHAIDYGCAIKNIFIRDYRGIERDIVLGFDNIAGYEKDHSCLGECLGRHAGRLREGKLVIGDKKYNLNCNIFEDHLHGGRKGFNRYVWQCEESDDKLIFSRISPDMEENYPGNLNVTVTYQLTKDNELIIDYNAISDKDTIVNLSNHSYFNLNGVSDMQEDLSILNHKIKLYADRMLVMDNDKRPDGNIINCIGTPYDFSSFKRVGDGISFMNKGYDDYYIANENHDDLKELKVVAEAYSEKTRIKMTCQSEEPGFIFYTGNYLFKKSGKYNKEYNQYSGFCIETHGYIDSVHNKNFPSLILPKNHVYHTRTVYSFDIF